MKRIKVLFLTLLITSFSYSQTISLIGSATPATNWYIDFNMTQDLQNPLVWTINITLTDGEVKFRQDAGWDVSWGGIDFPSGMAITDGPNIPVTAGNYNVVLNTGEPFYEFILNTSYGNVGINNESPQEKLDVNGNIRFSGELKPNGVSGTTGQLLKSNGNGTMGWAEASASSSGPVAQNGSVGYGTWGDCSMAGLSEYNPVGDTAGEVHDNLGYSVSISGDYAIVGIPGDKIGSNSVGSAIIYKRNSSTGRWEQDGEKLFKPDPVHNDMFGFSVFISGQFAIVGDPYDQGPAGADQGSACIFRRDSLTGSWVIDGSILFNLYASANDNFGVSVSLSGEYAIVGATDDDVYYNNQGSATIFKRNTAGFWEVEYQVINQDGQQNDHFGNSVAISGEYAIVGSPGDDDTHVDDGSACIFKRNNAGIWELQGSKLTYNYYDESQFGFSVSISGDYALIGSPGYNLSYNNHEGAAFFYKRNATTGEWDFSDVVVNKDFQPDDRFGSSVSISGDYAIIGAPGADEGSSINTGCAWIYVNIGSGFIRMQRIIDPAYSGLEYMPESCSIDGASRRFVLGSWVILNHMGKAIFGKVE